MEQVVALGRTARVDDGADESQRELTIRRTEDAVKLEWDQEVFSLPGADKDRIQDRARLFEREEGLTLALYQTDPPDASMILFYGLDVEGEVVYLGHHRANHDLFSLGPVRLERGEAVLDGASHALDARLPQEMESGEPKDAFLDYLGLPPYSLASGMGDANETESVAEGTILSYTQHDTTLLVTADRIERVCTTSGSLLGLDVGANIDETPDVWSAYAQDMRFEKGDADGSEAEHIRYGFDWDRYYVECLVQRTQAGRVIREICVELSELHAADIEGRKVLVDRFGDLLYRASAADWRTLVEAEDGYADMELLGFEQENGAVFFLAGQDGPRTAYFYQLEEDAVRELVRGVRTARLSGGLLTVETEDGERRYFDQGGADVTADVTGQTEQPEGVEFYVSDDTLYYLPADPAGYVIVPSLSQALSLQTPGTIKAYYDASHDIGLLHAVGDEASGAGALYLFRPETEQLILLADDAVRFGLISAVGSQETRILVTHANGIPSDHEVFSLTGVSAGPSDEAGNPLTEGS